MEQKHELIHFEETIHVFLRVHIKTKHVAISIPWCI